MANSWVENFQGIINRWPQWSPSKTDADDFTKAMAHLDQERVERAVLEVRKHYSSNEPRLAWFVRAYENLRNQERGALNVEAERTSERVTQWRSDQREAASDTEATKRELRDAQQEEVWAARDSLSRRFPTAVMHENNPGDDPMKWSGLYAGMVASEMRQLRKRCAS